MYTISNLARRSDIPRRTVQFWADNSVLVPEEPLLPRKRASYGERELDVVLMLRPFALMSTPVSVIKAIASSFRVLLTSQDHVLPGLVNAARRGETAYLVVQVFDTCAGTGTALSAAGTVENLGRAIASMMSEGNKRLLPVIAIDLSAALCRNDARAGDSNN